MNFDDIRPYRDYEVEEAIARLLNTPTFMGLGMQFFPKEQFEQIAQRLKEIKTIKEFQQDFISLIGKLFLSQTTEGVSSQGIENLKPSTPYLFISNHRDIILDPAILNIALNDAGFETTEIAIGDNLLIEPWISDMARLNKSFLVKRNVAPREMYEASQKLSSYIRHSIKERNSSVWIAQREGRTKDGFDRTHSGLLKMLSVSGGDDLIENLRELNIVPVSISYELDPCDLLKAKELILKMEAGYKKTPQDDLNSMMTGIMGKKGKVHLAIGTPLDQELDRLRTISNKNDQLKSLADMIDQQIMSTYRLWPANYIAYDLVHPGNAFSSQYNKPDKERFDNYIGERLATMGESAEKLKKNVLSMYANTVINKTEIVNTAL